MLTDLNNTLKQLLTVRVLKDYPNGVDINFDCPKREWSSKIVRPTIDLYLFDLRENLDLRKTAWKVAREPNGRTGVQRPPVFVDLSYFITAWAREIADEHQLLWHVMTALMREPIYGDDVRQGAMMRDNVVVSTRTAQADGVLRNPGEFWSALDNDLKPAVVYGTTLAVDLDVWAEAPLTLTTIMDLGLTNAKDGHAYRHITIGGTVRTRRPPGTAGTRAKSQMPVPGAVVVFPALGLRVESNEHGRFVAAGVPEGTHHVQVRVGDKVVSEQEIVVKVEGVKSGAKEAASDGGRGTADHLEPELSVTRQQYDLEV